MANRKNVYSEDLLNSSDFFRELLKLGEGERLPPLSEISYDIKNKFENEKITGSFKQLDVTASFTFPVPLIIPVRLTFLKFSLSSTRVPKSRLITSTLPL
jgi:hypothetical protein